MRSPFTRLLGVGKKVHAEAEPEKTQRRVHRDLVHRPDASAGRCSAAVGVRQLAERCAQLGGYLTAQLRQNLNPLQVVDLHKTDPKVALRQFSALPRVRILVCGGDGTVAWILQTMESLTEIDPKPPVGILPLGTGNDLARVLGWGRGFRNDLISELLLQPGGAPRRAGPVGGVHHAGTRTRRRRAPRRASVACRTRSTTR